MKNLLKILEASPLGFISGTFRSSYEMNKVREQLIDKRQDGIHFLLEHKDVIIEQLAFSSSFDSSSFIVSHDISDYKSVGKQLKLVLVAGGSIVNPNISITILFNCCDEYLDVGTFVAVKNLIKSVNEHKLFIESAPTAVGVKI